MTSNLEDKQGKSASADSPDPAQSYYDREFNGQTSPENYSKDGVEPSSLRGMEEKAGESGSSYSDGTSANSLSPSEVRDSEKNSDSGSLFRDEGEGPSRFKKVKGKVKNLAGNKLFIGGTVLGGGGFITVIIMAIILLGSLKIPNLMEHITGYQFARVTQQMARNTARVTATKIVVDSADERAYNRFKNKYYSNPASKVGQQWSKLDKYRPQKLVNNFDKNSSFKLVYKETGWGKPQLAGITVEGNRSIPVQSPTGLTRFIPGVKLANQISYSSKVAPILQTQLRANDVGFIVRGSVAKEIRKRAGISLIAWKIGEFKGKNPKQAGLQQARSIYNVVSDDKVSPSRTPLIRSASEKAKGIEVANVNDDAKLPKILDAKGVDTDVLASIDNSLKPSVLGTATSVVNPIYAFAAPMCIIYEGSLKDSAPVINSQSESQERLYYYLASAADQQKNGFSVEPEAIGALNEQLGDISTSNPEKRAAGLPVNTSDSLSVQASAGGNYSILDALLPDKVAGVGDKVAELCPQLLDVKTALAVGGLNIAFIVGSFGTAAGVEATALAAVQTATRALTQKIVTTFTSKLAAKQAVSKTGTILKSSLLTAGATAGLTVLANLVTHAKVNTVNNGLQTETDLIHSADSGGTIAANNLGREQFFGVPFSKQEVVKDAYANQQWLNSKRQNESLSTRYLALSNPDSLLTKMALNLQSLTSITNALERIASSIQTLPRTFSSIITGQTFAAEPVSTAGTYYGVMQWGFTDAELKLMQNDPSYSYLDNQDILDKSGNSIDIANTYAECFGYLSDENGNLTPGGPKIGDLLADGRIIRDENGDVLNGDHLCSENSLSMRNPIYGDMVFRWRVANSDSKTIDQLVEAQEPVAPSADTATPETPSTAVSNPADIFGRSDTMTCPAGTKDGGVRDGYEKNQIVPIRICLVSGIDVNAKIAGSVLALIKDAESKGVKLSGGGFRTMAEQTKLYNRNCGGSGGCRVATAKPGFSNHQMGLAIDFVYADQGRSICYPRPSAQCSGNPGFTWLVQNASRYGLKNLPKEAWHWSVDGT